MKIIHDFDLQQVTTFHLPAKARVFAEYGSVGELRDILLDPQFAGMSFMAMGGGSNLLFTSDFEGVILHSAMRSIDIIANHGDTVEVKVEAGVNWDTFVKYCVDNNLYGAENLSYIPGETGASAVQNVGAYGVEAKDIIIRVMTIERATGKEREFSVGECRYGYRDSIFKHPEMRDRFIVTHVIFKLWTIPRFSLGYGSLKELADIPGLTLAQVRQRIIDIRRSKLPEPDVLGSAGSFFKNPVIPRELFEQLRHTYPDIPSYPAGEDVVKVPAAWLIETTGLKGKRSGGAEVYRRQCLVIVNTGNATADDVIALYREISDSVRQRFGIELQPEVNIIGALP